MLDGSKSKEWLFEGQTGGMYSERGLAAVLEQSVKKAGIKKPVSLHYSAPAPNNGNVSSNYTLNTNPAGKLKLHLIVCIDNSYFNTQNENEQKWLPSGSSTHQR